MVVIHNNTSPEIALISLSLVKTSLGDLLVTMGYKQPSL